MRVLPFAILFLILNIWSSSMPALVFNKQGSSSVENAEIKIIFTVYENQANTVRLNLTIINLGDDFILKDHTWGYFNAEVFSIDDVYLGKVRDEDDEKMLFFLAKNGTHVRHWIWNYTVKNEVDFTTLDEGRYKIRGVFAGPDYTLKTDVFEVYLKYIPQLPAAKRYVNQYGNALLSASFGVLVSGFIQHVFISLFYPEPVNWPSKKRMITILWMLVIIFSTLLLAFSSEFGYDIIRIIIER